MVATDFPAWYSAGVFGGIACALLSAIAIATWALWRRRGVTGEVIAALLVCVVASALDIGPLLWIEYRLSVYGPTLAAGEVGAALAADALVGWVAPLAAICWYALLATPAALAAPGLTPRPARQGSVTPAALDDPARERAALPDGHPWGLLTPVDAAPDASSARPIALKQALTLIGREQDNDIVLDDERISRRHAELRWERGRVEFADYGSLNGTRVNQQAARGRMLLRDGDVIELGGRRYRLTVVASAPAATPDSAPATPQPALSSDMETRKTASASGSFALGAPALQITLIQGGDGRQMSWPLVAPVTTIGRDPTCSVALADSSISRTHAQIARQPAGYFVADLQSSNGVTVNGARLSAPTQIFAGDVIGLGDALLRCEQVPETPTADEMTTTKRPIVAPAPTTPDTADATSISQPAEAPTFHLRIAPQWRATRASRPRLAPPRLAPAPPRDEPSQD